VDLHALTMARHSAASGNQLRSDTRSMAAALLACGIDPKRSTLFAQSTVRAHTELCWLLSCVTPHSWLNPMTQFKEKAKSLKQLHERSKLQQQQQQQQQPLPSTSSTAAADSVVDDRGGGDEDSHSAASLGLFVYPVLQTADILLY